MCVRVCTYYIITITTVNIWLKSLVDPKAIAAGLTMSIPYETKEILDRSMNI